MGQRSPSVLLLFLFSKDGGGGKAAVNVSRICLLRSSSFSVSRYRDEPASVFVSVQVLDSSFFFLMCFTSQLFSKHLFFFFGFTLFVCGYCFPSSDLFSSVLLRMLVCLCDPPSLSMHRSGHCCIGTVECVFFSVLLLEWEVGARVLVGKCTVLYFYYWSCVPAFVGG